MAMTIHLSMPSFHSIPSHQDDDNLFFRQLFAPLPSALQLPPQFGMWGSNTSFFLLTLHLQRYIQYYDLGHTSLSTDCPLTSTDCPHTDPISGAHIPCSTGHCFSAPPAISQSLQPLLGYQRMLALLTSPTDPSHHEPTASAEIKETLVTRARAKFKLSDLPRLSNFHILSALFLFVALLLQLLGSSNPPVVFPHDHTLSPFGDSVRHQEAYYDQLEPGTQCRPKSPFDPELPYSRAPTNMALHGEVKRMAAEFDYPPEEVNKGVKEFIRQMEEGLEKQGTDMSQIPTYVTAVPNGTEKVCHAASPSVYCC